MLQESPPEQPDSVRAFARILRTLGPGPAKIGKRAAMVVQDREGFWELDLNQPNAVCHKTEEKSLPYAFVLEGTDSALLDMLKASPRTHTHVVEGRLVIHGDVQKLRSLSQLMCWHNSWLGHRVQLEKEEFVK